MMSGMYNLTIIVKCLLKMDKKIDKWLKNEEKRKTQIMVSVYEYQIV